VFHAKRSATNLNRRIHEGYFRDDFLKVISALGYLWGGSKLQFDFRVQSLPGDNPKPSSGPILDPTEAEGVRGGGDE